MRSPELEVLGRPTSAPLSCIADNLSRKPACVQRKEAYEERMAAQLQPSFFAGIGEVERRLKPSLTKSRFPPRGEFCFLKACGIESHQTFGIYE